MKTLCFYLNIALLIALANFLPLKIKAQQIDEKFILNYWVFSPGESEKPIETYRLRDFEFNPSLDQFTIGAGSQFYSNHTVKKFRVKLCGNDYEPNFKAGKWKIYKENGLIMLKINFKKEVDLFEIKEISKDKLILHTENTGSHKKAALSGLNISHSDLPVF